MSRRGVIVGVDVGGTFTDLFLLDSVTGTFRTAKVPSRRGDEAVGFLNGLNALGGASGMDSIVHGTTVGTNTLLERRGPQIGVITTRGFRDTLEMRRRDRRQTWGLWGDFIPIAERDMRIEVDERTLADGSILRLPRMRITAIDGTDMERHPRTVDTEVTRPIGEPATGVDSQLDAAIRSLLARLGRAE